MCSTKWGFFICVIFYVSHSLAKDDIGNHSVQKRNVVHMGLAGIKHLMPNNNGKQLTETSVSDSPPDHKDYVAMARYVVHKTDWSSLATISRIPNILNYPFTSVVSMSDGTVEKSVGIPYFYLTPLDFPAIDLAKDSRCTISVSLEQTGYCRSQILVPDDPRCARVMLSGTIAEVKNGTAEYDFAKEALFSRHESMRKLPANHGFFVAKMDVEQIVLLDWFGGPIFISLNDYFKYNGTSIYYKV